MGEEELYLRARIKELEEKLAQVRLSRRVLLYLLEKMEGEKELLLKKLERENERLQRLNARYARSLWQKNRRIVELESKLQGKES
ncbi:translation initiation factor 2 [Ammonifex thiophilus]|uniref:Translation initiation factor 2 n=1 Tax=Ammonifex thiophilus TaxID=444093 RepID=A0A3D8P3M9_9THEO|nr:translation initiation factor 2 [Ammonifex thiophilus]RDV83415.1 translation initiation factor 2 [Ammonifex thiophilus]